MSGVPATPSEAQRTLSESGPAWWRGGHADRLAHACSAVPRESLRSWPDLARWRALGSLLGESAEGLNCLEQAYLGHLERADPVAAGLDACLALVVCLIDIGGMDRVTSWLERVDGAAVFDSAAAGDGEPWRALGVVAHAVLGARPHPTCEAARRWLIDQLRPLNAFLAPNERLIAALVLVNACFAAQEFEQFEFIESLLSEPPDSLDGAAPVLRARWHYMLGYAYYQIGAVDRAEAAWQHATTLADRHGLDQTGQMIVLALLRLALDRGRLADAVRLEARIATRGSSARASQLVQAQQMQARLQLLQGTPTKAWATLRSSLALSEREGMSAPERASGLTDLVQVLIANERPEEAERLLVDIAAAQAGRDAEVFLCLLELLRGWSRRHDDAAAGRELLARGLRRAQAARYTMFYRLLPEFAGQLCGLAMGWNIEPVFVREVVLARELAAPADAGESWPWTLWLRLFGPPELTVRGEKKAAAGRQQRRPLELLHAIACEPSLSLGARTTADLLWPDAGGDPLHNLEMTVQRLRRLLGDDSLVRVADGRVGLDPKRARSDVALRRRLSDRLQDLAIRMPVGAAPAQAAECFALVARIVDLSRGPLLQGAPESPWLEAERRRCLRDLTRTTNAIESVAARAPVAAAEQAVLLSALRGLSGS